MSTPSAPLLLLPPITDSFSLSSSRRQTPSGNPIVRYAHLRDGRKIVQSRTEEVESRLDEIKQINERKTLALERVEKLVVIVKIQRSDWHNNEECFPRQALPGSTTI